MMSSRLVWWLLAGSTGRDTLKSMSTRTTTILFRADPCWCANEKGRRVFVCVCIKRSSAEKQGIKNAIHNTRRMNAVTF